MIRRRVLIGAATSTLASGGAGAVGPGVGDRFVPVANPSGAPLTLRDLPVGGAPVLAWPFDPTTGRPRTTRFDHLLLLRVDHAPAANPRVAAYSAICTHAGCLVSVWLAAQRLLHCPCHGSSFDPDHDGAVASGPAALPLPSLPVANRAGVLVATGPLSARPGGHTGRTD